MDIEIVNCGECGNEIEEIRNEIDKRIPCGKCGSLTRVQKASIHETANAQDGIGMKLKRNGKGKSIYEAKTEYKLFRKTGEITNIDRIIDREGNKYKEEITAPVTGEVIHRCDEALSDHKGHGDDKKNKTKITNA
jgi:hypothetical protein